jgi:hypothetical protein
MTRKHALPTQWVRTGIHQENASNTVARLVQTTSSASPALGKINILSSVVLRLHWHAKRPDGRWNKTFK